MTFRLFESCHRCGRRLPPIPGCTAGLISEVGDALFLSLESAVDVLTRSTDWDAPLARGYLTCPHFVPASANQCRVLLKANRVTPDSALRRILELWIDSDRARVESAGLDAAWAALTDPENLSALEAWASMQIMSRSARDTCTAALRDCRARCKLG